jgi:hypothetical protein
MELLDLLGNVFLSLVRVLVVERRLSGYYYAEEKQNGLPRTFAGSSGTEYRWYHLGSIHQGTFSIANVPGVSTGATNLVVSQPILDSLLCQVVV